MQRKHRLKIGADHHAKTTDSEVITVDVDLGKQGEHYVVVQHLSSQKCIVIDHVYPDGERLRYENLYYDEA